MITPGHTSADELTAAEGAEPEGSFRRMAIWLGLVITAFCFLTAGIALTKRPWCDEGWFAGIAYNLVYRGVMSLTVLDPHGFPFAPMVKGIDQYTFWVMPGYMFMQAVWYKLFGVSAVVMRSISILWGAVAILGWYYIVTRVTRSRAVGVIAAGILAADQHFMVAGASGRMDMMSTGINLAAVAVYLRLRERFHLALLVACIMLAAGLMTHPNAAFGAILLSLIVLLLDRNQIRWQSFGIAAAPFLVAIALWAAYVSKAPDVFVSQMQAQSSVPHRLEFDPNPVRQFGGELYRRYAGSYRLRSSSLPVKITGLPVLLYFLAVACLFAVPALRRRPGAMLIAFLALVDFILLSCLQDNWYYLVHILPAFAAAVAICVRWLWDQRRLPRLAAVAAVGAICTLNMGVIGFRIVHNDYGNRYLKAVDYLQRHASPDALIVGSAELAFDLGFDGRVIDDSRLGYTSGLRPDYIVLEAHYSQFWFSWFETHEASTLQYVRKLLAEDYEKVYDQAQDRYKSMGSSDLPYRIYKRKAST